MAGKQKKLNILIPDVVDAGRSKAELLTHNSEKEDYFKELDTMTRELDFVPVLRKVFLSTIKSTIDSIPRDELILNLCDGCDVDGVPGPSVATYLEEKGFPGIIGCDALFIQNTLTKNGMKELFQAHMVTNPPGFAVTSATDILMEVEKHGMMYPLFVKVSDSYGSVGIDDSSVCHDQDQLIAKCSKLLGEFENLTVEEFIDGQEFSVLILGNCRQPDASVIVYPAAERAFNKSLGRFQKFISFDRNWDETLLAHSYEKVEDANDAMALQDLARRAYFAVSGNCYGRVDIRKRDVSGKFYVLEVNASCGLGKGTSSEFILHLAGQTTQDFFKILLSMTLTPPSETSTSEVSSIATTGLLPVTLKEQVSQLIEHPSLATVPTPVVHVIVSAVLVESQILDPEQKLVSIYGKDVEYVSELEGTFRSLGYDPIVHLFHVDPIEKTMDSLDRENDLIFNACLGSDGCAVANTLNKLGFKKTVGLNADFFKQSSSRPATRKLLAEAGIRISPGTILELQYDATLSPTVMMQAALKDIKAKMEANGIVFPVYLKPAQVFRHQEGQHSGRCVHTEDQLRHFLLEISSTETAHGKPKNAGEVWILESLAIGTEFRVLVAGDGRDPSRDVIVLPPIKYNAPPSTVTNSLGSSTLFGSTKSLLQRRESARVMDKDQTHQASKNYSPMKTAELMLQMDIQDLARRAYSAVHGSCYGLVHLVDQSNGEGLVVLGVQGDVRFGENAKASIVMQLAGLTMSDLFQWLLQRAAWFEN